MMVRLYLMVGLFKEIRGQQDDLTTKLLVVFFFACYKDIFKYNYANLQMPFKA